MFFTVVARDGELFETNHVSPAYSETDRSQQISFVSAAGKLHELRAADVLSIRVNTVPFPARCCPNCRN